MAKALFPAFHPDPEFPFAFPFPRQHESVRTQIETKLAFDMLVGKKSKTSMVSVFKGWAWLNAMVDPKLKEWFITTSNVDFSIELTSNSISPKLYFTLTPEMLALTYKEQFSLLSPVPTSLSDFNSKLFAIRDLLKLPATFNATDPYADNDEDYANDEDTDDATNDTNHGKTLDVRKAMEAKWESQALVGNPLFDAYFTHLRSLLIASALTNPTSDTLDQEIATCKKEHPECLVVGIQLLTKAGKLSKGTHGPLVHTVPEHLFPNYIYRATLEPDTITTTAHSFSLAKSKYKVLDTTQLPQIIQDPKNLKAWISSIYSLPFRESVPYFKELTNVVNELIKTDPSQALDYFNAFHEGRITTPIFINIGSKTNPLNCLLTLSGTKAVPHKQHSWNSTQFCINAQLHSFTPLVVNADHRYIPLNKFVDAIIKTPSILDLSDTSKELWTTVKPINVNSHSGINPSSADIKTAFSDLEAIVLSGHKHVTDLKTALL